MGKLIGIARREAHKAPMELLNEAEIAIKGGVANDFRGQGRQRQVTILAIEDWRAALAELGVTDETKLPWTVRRANLLTEGLALPREAGARLKIGAAELEVNIETAPCARMDEAYQGLRAALTPHWRGGVCCAVVTGAHVALGDEAVLAR